MSEALKQHDAGELVQQNRAEARVNVGLSCLEKQPRRRRREPFLLLASNNPHAQWYFRASARYATLFLERRQVVLLPLSCLPRPIRTNSHHDISSCVLPAGAHIMVHILRELMLAEATIHDDHAYGAGRLGMPVMLLSCGVWWWRRNWCVSSVSPVASTFVLSHVPAFRSSLLKKRTTRLRERPRA